MGTQGRRLSAGWWTKIPSLRVTQGWLSRSTRLWSMADSRAELEAMDREELKALLDERGIEYSPHAHTPTLVDLALGEEKGGEVAEATGEEVEAQAAEEEEAPFYQPQVFSPWELPANTVAAQQYMDRGLVVD